MYKNLLPIGSVVLLKGGEKRLMICGRIQTRAGSDRVYDYSACLYPEGITGPAGMYFFDREAVETFLYACCYGERNGIAVLTVEEKSPEYAAGLRPGDKIVTLNGKSFFLTWRNFAKELMLATGEVEERKPAISVG